jgi:ubiquinone/menaquinone biosynthesis C-methylase UbiE
MVLKKSKRMNTDRSQAVDVAATASKARVQDHFHRSADEWNDVYFGRSFQSVHIQLRQRLVMQLVDGLKLPVESHALEIGCGAGQTTALLARRFRVDALDFAPNMVATARATCRELGLATRVNFITGDAENLPFDDAIFDLVVCMGVISYLPEWRRALTEAFRVVKPGGSLIITCPNKWGLSHLFNPPFLRVGTLRRLLTRSEKFQRVPPTRQFSPSEFDSALRRTGFNLRTSLSHTYGPFCPLGLNVVPARLSIRIHDFLQHAADSRWIPVLHRLGKHYIALADKSLERQ